MESSSKLEEEPAQSVEQITIKLSDLNNKIQQNPNNYIDFLKEYATIYVQNHNLSDDLFSIMCQHNMIAKLFSEMSKSVRILQIFNLILANTSNQSELVYIFSHPLFHEYLLSNFNPSKESSQSIQYYIQLIKTVIMKLQQQSNYSLLKLFCNNKYPQFPLLLNCLVLSVKKNVKQDLVRVTSLHCILQLIQLIIKKELGYGYLSQIHIFIFFYQVIKEVIEQESIDEENMLKYVIDLMKALKSNEQSILIFFSLLSNILVFENISNPGPALHILYKLSIYFSESEQLNEFVPKYLGPIYHLMAKYMFNRYLTNVQIGSLITLKQIMQQEQNQYNVIKLVKDRFSKKEIVDYVFAIDKKIKIQFEKVIKQKVSKYNQENPNFISLKQNYMKNKKQSNGSWFYSAFMKKFSSDYANIEYLKKITTLAGIKFQMGEPINISQGLNQTFGLYFYEFHQAKSKQKYCFGQKSEDTLKTQINYNECRGAFSINRQFLKTLVKIQSICLQQLQQTYHNKSVQERFKIAEAKYNSKFNHVGEIYFTLHFKKYLQCSLFEYFFEQKIIKNKFDIQILYQIVRNFCLKLDPNCKTKLHQKLTLLKQELKASIKEKGFKTFIRYIQNNEEDQMVKIQMQQKKMSEIKYSNNNLSDSKKKVKRRSIFKSTKQKKKDVDKKQSNLRKKSSSLNKQNNESQLQDYQLICLKMLQFQLIRHILTEKQENIVEQAQQHQVKFQSTLKGVIYKNYVQKYHPWLLKPYSSMQPSTQLMYIKNIKFHQNEECRFVVTTDPYQCSITCSVRLYDKTLIEAQIKQYNFKAGQNQTQVNLGSQYSSIGFKNKEAAQNFLLQISKIKFQLQEMLSYSVQQYLSDGDLANNEQYDQVLII